MIEYDCNFIASNLVFIIDLIEIIQYIYYTHTVDLIDFLLTCLTGKHYTGPVPS